MLAVGQQQTSHQQRKILGQLGAWDSHGWGAEARSQHPLRWALQITSFEIILRELSSTLLGLRGM